MRADLLLLRYSTPHNVACLFCRREAVPLHLGRLHMEIRPLRWVDEALQKTHRLQTVPLSTMRTSFREVRSSRPPHETSSTRLSVTSIFANFKFATTENFAKHKTETFFEIFAEARMLLLITFKFEKHFTVSCPFFTRRLRCNRFFSSPVFILICVFGFVLTRSIRFYCDGAA